MNVYPRLFEIHIILTNTLLRQIFNSSLLGFLPTFVAIPSLAPLILSSWIYISERSNQSLSDCHIHPATNLPSNQEAIHQINMHFFLKSFAEKMAEQESAL